MRLPVSWLNELLSKPVEPIEMRDALTRVGLEIEGLESHAPGLETVVVGKIVAIGAHPDADKLRICQTDVGTGEPLQIVTGAQNVQLNDKIPVALVGSVLPGNKAINAAKLRGVESFGMYCSLVELGLPPGIDGVHILPEDASIGAPIAQAMSLGELVLDVAVTANRPDCLSAIGLARELAVAIPGTSLKLPQAKVLPLTGESPVHLGSVDAERAPYYAGLGISGVKIAPSPEWLVKRLEGAGMRAINNVVDVTNYVMLLTGQPLHAFDVAKIHGRTINVRPASAGETLVTLDGVERKLTAEDTVIADGDRALVVAGVMGGKDAEVDESSTDLFLEAAYFKPQGVRMTSRRLGLSTESSYRFERGVDPQATLYALELCRDLILELAGGNPVGGLQEARRQGWPPAPTFTFRLDQIERLLGVNVPNPEVERILKALGFQLARHTDGVFELNSYDVTVPGWRIHDVKREADLVEEVGRHYGYDRIPASLPPVVKRPSQPAIDVLSARARAIATRSGLSEVVTSSLTSPQAEATAGIKHAKHVRLANPLGDLSVMRSSLLPSLLEVLRYNRYQGQSRLGIFELGRSYELTGEGENTQETLWVGGALMATVWEGMWLVEHTPAPLKADFYYAKGLVELLVEGLEVEGRLSFRETDQCPTLHPGRSAEVLVDGEVVGLVGELHPRVAEAYDLPSGAAASAWLLDLSKLAKKPPERVRFQPFSRFPATLRDLAVLVSNETPANALLDTIREAGGELLERAALFDRYEGAQVPEGHVSLGFSLVYRAGDRTLSVEDVEPTQQRILERLKERHGATLRG
ncbi:MAG TPA: phenylalanine--tRNA ligase subunit beta [Oscillatoriaceae cyanobacterium]